MAVGVNEVFGSREGAWHSLTQSMQVGPKPYMFQALRDKFNKMKPGAKKEITHIYISPEDIEKVGVPLSPRSISSNRILASRPSMPCTWQRR
jgi:hypothetical protein